MNLDEDTLMNINIATKLDKELLDELGETLCVLVEEDEASRKRWLDSQSDWLKLAAQVVERKMTPWENAANVKYPLLTTAAIQFHARAYGSLIQEPNLVNIRVYGDDPDGNKSARGYRTSRYMNYQLLEEMEDWIEGMDRLLVILPIVGMAYKKTYWSELRQQVVSELISVKDVILNYHARKFDTARKTHRMWLTENQIEEYKRRGIFLNIELPQTTWKMQDETHDRILGMAPAGGETVKYDMPRELYEIHWVWDLDKDGYKEPWIFTVDRDSRKILRITPRFEMEDIVPDESGKRIALITPREQFTCYTFIPDPNSPLYGIGFGVLLGPLNSAINTTINQLIDAGTLANMPSGFLGRGLNLRGGPIKLTPGKWQMIQNTGDDLKKEILPIPATPPSTTLFSLLGMLINSGEKLSTISDMMVGESPGQNQPFATTSAVLEQGLKVFVGIYKRIYRALGKEYKKIFGLNGQFMNEEHYFTVLDSGQQGFTGKQDFTSIDCDIRPQGDPNTITDAQKMMKAQMLLQKVQMGFPLNTQEVLRRVLEAEGHQDIQLLMNAPPPPPPPELQLKMREQEHKEKMDMIDKQLDAMRAQFEALKDKAQAVQLLATAEATGVEVNLKGIEMLLDSMDAEEAHIVAKYKLLADMANVDKQAEMQHEQIQHEKEMGVTAMAHDEKMGAQKNAQRNSGSANKAAGSKTSKSS